jgi:hypothetical protein
LKSLCVDTRVNQSDRIGWRAIDSVSVWMGRDVPGDRERQPRTCHSSRAEGGSPSRRGSQQASPCFQGTQSILPQQARTAPPLASTQPPRPSRGALPCRPGTALRPGRRCKIGFPGIASQRSRRARRSRPAPAPSTRARQDQPHNQAQLNRLWCRTVSSKTLPGLRSVPV